jgi:hypothetical protein
MKKRTQAKACGYISVTLFNGFCREMQEQILNLIPILEAQKV